MSAHALQQKKKTEMASKSSAEQVVDDDEQTVNQAEAETKLESPPPAKRRRGRRAPAKRAPVRKRTPAKGKGRSRASKTAAEKEEKEQEVEAAPDDSDLLSAVFDQIDESAAKSSSEAAMKDDDDGDALSTTPPPTAPVARSGPFSEVGAIEDFLLEHNRRGSDPRPRTFVVWESAKKSKGYGDSRASALIFNSFVRNDASVVRCSPTREALCKMCPTFDQATMCAFDLHRNRPLVVAVNHKNAPIKIYSCSSSVSAKVAVNISEAKRLGRQYRVYFYESRNTTKAPRLFVCADSRESANEIVTQFLVHGGFVPRGQIKGVKRKLFHNEASEIRRDDMKTNYVIVQ